MASTLESKDELRIVLLGKTGVGLSTLGNAILGSKKFKSEMSPSSWTTECQEGIREFEGKSLAIVDTPGLFNTEISAEEVKKALLRCITSTMPGPHVLLLVLRTDEFSREDKKVLEVFKKIFEGAKRHTIVVFNRDDEKSEKEYEKFIGNHGFLKNFINECCETHLEVCKTKIESQAKYLLKKINDMVRENEGSVYKGEMFKEAVKSFEEAMKCYDTSGGDTGGAKEMDMETWRSMLVNAVDHPEQVMMKGVEKFIEFIAKLVGRRNQC